jgi:hypothetical protein
MGNTTFSGPVRSENGFQTISINSLTGTVTSGALVSNILVGTATLDFPSIAGALQDDLTITVTGAAVGDSVALSLPAAPTVGISFNAFVSAANTVTVRATNTTAVAIDPASATYSVLVFNAS